MTLVVRVGGERVVIPGFALLMVRVLVRPLVDNGFPLA